MDNMSELIGSVLNDPAAVEKLRGMAAQLGLGGQTSDQADDRADEKSAPDGTAASGTPELFGRIAPLLGKLGGDDDMSRLIRALKPYLTGSRLRRAEEAEKIVVIMRLIPLLKEYPPAL